MDLQTVLSDRKEAPFFSALIQGIDVKTQLRNSLVLACFLIQAAPLTGQDVVIHTIEGSRITSSLDAVSIDGAVSGSNLSTGLTINDISLIQTNRTATPENTEFIVLLIGGSEINASQVRMADQKYSITAAGLDFELGAESVQAIMTRKEAQSSLLARLLGEPNTSSDRVVVRTTRGEQAVTGLLEEITAGKIKIEAGGKSRSISTDRVEVIGIVLTDLLQKLPAGTIGRVELTDGSSIVGAIRSLDQGVLQVTVPGDAVVNIEWKLVSRIAVRSDRVTYLSDLEPAEAEVQAYGSSHFPWQADRNVFGEALTLFDPEAGVFKEYARGVGTHSDCRLEYDVSGVQYSRFSALVGLDSRAKHQGDCEVSVHADGIEIWKKRIVGKQAPELVDLDVQGVDRITIIVQAGQHLDLGDHVNWVNARLLK